MRTDGGMRSVGGGSMDNWPAGGADYIYYGMGIVGIIHGRSRADAIII
jgi:hypothetical protein